MCNKTYIVLIMFVTDILIFIHFMWMKSTKLSVPIY